MGYVGDQQNPLAHLHGRDEKVKVIGDIERAEAQTFVADVRGSSESSG